MTAWWLWLMRHVCRWRGHDPYVIWTHVLDDRGSFSHRAYVEICGRCDFRAECPPFISVKVGRVK